MVGVFILFYFLLGFYLFIFREGGREGEREREKHQCVVASLTTPSGDLAGNQALALTGNRTSDPLVHRLVLNPLSHTSQGCIVVLTCTSLMAIDVEHLFMYIVFGEMSIQILSPFFI